MNEPTHAPTEAARQLVADFVWQTCDAARRTHGAFALDERAVERLYQSLSQVLSDRTLAAELIDRCLRYLAFFLADSGVHHEAMKAAVMIHEYRARVLEEVGRKSRAWATRAAGASISVSWDPLRVVSYSLAVYLTLSAALLLTSIISWAFTGEAAIVMTDTPTGQPNMTPGAYQHLYFAAVTLTTLGYGDVHPNLRHWWGCIPAALCVLGAFGGYVILAGIVAVVMNRSGIHPYARIGEWMTEFEREFIGKPVPLFRWPPE